MQPQQGRRFAGAHWLHYSRRRCLATLLPFLACHAQCRTREGLQPSLADRVAAPLADAVCAVVDAGEGPLGLAEDLSMARGQRHLVLSLERLRTGVGLV